MLFRSTLLRRSELRLGWDEVKALRLGSDQVYSGFAIAGSSAAETYSVPSLRLVLDSGESALLDRSGSKRLQSLAERFRDFLETDLEVEEPAKNGS